MSHVFVWVCACTATYVLTCVLLCIRSGRSLVLWAGTSAMSLMTVTGSLLCSTSTSTAKKAPSLGTLSSTSLVGKPTHRDKFGYLHEDPSLNAQRHTCTAQVDVFGDVCVCVCGWFCFTVYCNNITFYIYITHSFGFEKHCKVQCIKHYMKFQTVWL